MLFQEIIQLKRIPETSFRPLIQQALNHSLWNYVLYFEETDDIEQKLFCLLNESLSKLLFRFFCLQNKLPIIFEQQNGNRFLDFKFQDKNWELINLFIKNLPINLTAVAPSLPAMIPAEKLDYSQKDIFGNKIIRWTGSLEKQALFTYLQSRLNKESFLRLALPVNLETLYIDLITRKRKGKTLRESDFWKQIQRLGIPSFELNHLPEFYITAWAGQEHWKFFYSANPSSFPNIETTNSENKMLMVHRLPAFSRLFPQLMINLNFAEFLN